MMPTLCSVGEPLCKTERSHESSGRSCEWSSAGSVTSSLGSSAALAREPPHGAPTARASKVARFFALRCAAEGRRLRCE
eukprot:43920-Alexandrium_andersonii.AAC.1